MSLLNKVVVLAFILAGVVSTASAANSHSGTGIGGYVEGGEGYEHIGVFARLWQTPKKVAVDLNLGFDPDLDGIGFRGVYGMFYDPFKIKGNFSLPLYWGPQVGFGYWKEDYDPWDNRWDRYNKGFAIGGGVTGGITMAFSNIPLDINLAFNPTIQFEHREWSHWDSRYYEYDDNEINFQISAQFGLHYYF